MREADNAGGRWYREDGEGVDRLEGKCTRCAVEEGEVYVWELGGGWRGMVFVVRSGEMDRTRKEINVIEDKENSSKCPM